MAKDPNKLYVRVGSGPHGIPPASSCRTRGVPRRFPPQSRPSLDFLAPSLPRRLSHSPPLILDSGFIGFRTSPLFEDFAPPCFLCSVPCILLALGTRHRRHFCPQCLVFATPRGHRFTKTAQNNLRLGVGLRAVLILMMLPLAIISVVVFPFSFQRRLGCQN